MRGEGGEGWLKEVRIVGTFFNEMLILIYSKSMNKQKTKNKITTFKQ